MPRAVGRIVVIIDDIVETSTVKASSRVPHAPSAGSAQTAKMSLALVSSDSRSTPKYDNADTVTNV